MFLDSKDSKMAFYRNFYSYSHIEKSLNKGICCPCRPKQVYEWSHCIEPIDINFGNEQKLVGLSAKAYSRGAATDVIDEHLAQTCQFLNPSPQGGHNENMDD